MKTTAGGGLWLAALFVLGGFKLGGRAMVVVRFGTLLKWCITAPGGSVGGTNIDIRQFSKKPFLIGTICSFKMYFMTKK